jgi:hypothetical protein
VKVKCLTEKLLAEALAAGFTTYETEDEHERVAPLVQAAAVLIVVRV